MENQKLKQVARGLSQDLSTGLFKEVTVRAIKLRDGREIRYKTIYELGYIVGYHGLDFTYRDGLFNSSEDEFNEGLWAGRKGSREDQQTGQR